MSDNLKPFNPGEGRPHIAALLDRIAQSDGKHADRSYAASIRRIERQYSRVLGHWFTTGLR